MSKRILALMLVLCLMMGMIPAVSAATSGTCGPNLNWSYNADTATLTISGSGEMTDFLTDTSKPIPWSGLEFETRNLVVKQGVTTLGTCAFQNFGELTSVELPDSLVKIGERTFEGCYALRSIDLPDSITTVGNYAFENAGLTEVRIPEGVRELNSGAFMNCESLKDVTFPDGLELIGMEAFRGCTALSRVELPESMILLGRSAFASTGLTGIAIPDQVISIHPFCFDGCSSLTEVDMGSSVRDIGEYAFQGCSSLSEIDLPDSLEYIGDYAFRWCALSDVVIPQLVNEFGSAVFSSDTRMRIQFTGNAPAFRSDSFSYLIADVYYPQGNSTWNEDVLQAYGGELTWIPYDSETEEPDISEPTEPDPTNPTEPEPDPNTGVCGESVTWTLDPESGKLTLRGSGDMTDYESYEDVPWYRGTPGVVRTVDVGDNITSIGDYAFAYCGGITDVRLPEGLERIGANAFFDCVELENIQIPETVTEIGTHAFYKCNEIHDVKLPDSITEIADYAFAYCRRFTVNIPSRVTRIGAGAFYRCGGDTVTVPATVKFVGEYAFATCEFDRLVFLGDAPEIQDNAFYGAELNCFYPRGNATWTEEVRQGYGTSHITWTACDPDDLDIPDYQPDPEPPGQFTDVKESSYCYEPVLWAVENGITTGMSATKFMPDNPCTRAQVVTFLWRAAGEPLPVSGKNPFTDVKSSAYYYNAVLWAVEQGITTGMSATSFGPDRPCTRGQVVTFLHRAAGETEPESAGNPFTDVKESGFYYKAVLWAVENGITTGMSATRFEPGRTCTRGQVVTFLYRAN